MKFVCNHALAKPAYNTTCPYGPGFNYV